MQVSQYVSYCEVCGLSQLYFLARALDWLNLNGSCWQVFSWAYLLSVLLSVLVRLAWCGNDVCSSQTIKGIYSSHSSLHGAWLLFYCPVISLPGDSGYPHDGRADKNPYPHDRRADKDSYPHDSNNQCVILRLQLSFVVINKQMMLV